MSFALAVIQPTSLQSCQRCGGCCENVLHTWSPRAMRERFEWRLRERHNLPQKPNEVAWACPTYFGTTMFCESPTLRKQREDYEQCGLFSIEAIIEKHGMPERDLNDVRDDPFIVYEMYNGRCRGVMRFRDGPESFRYVNSCSKLAYEEVDGKRLAVCTIHATKPLMCSSYPWNERYRAPSEPYAALEDENPAYMQGCGYNKDKSAGISEANIERLMTPLNQDEL